MSDTPPQDPAELQERLSKAEEEIARLRDSGGPTTGRTARTGRALGAFLLVAIGVLVALVAVVAVWVKDVALDTNEYVSIVAPLADNQEITDGVAALAVDRLFTVTDADARARAALDEVLPADGKFLTGAIVAGLRQITTQAVERVLASEEFAKIWADANRLAHEQMVAILLDEQSGPVTASDGTVELDLSQVLVAAQQQLQELGAGGILSRVDIPDSALTITVANSEELERAQVGAQLLNELGTWLPIIAIALIGGGILLANRRRKTLINAMIALAVVLLVFLVALRIARTFVLGDLKPGLPSAVGEDLWHAAISPLRSEILWVLFGALVLALIGWLTGPGPMAVRVRHLARVGGVAVRERAAVALTHREEIGAHVRPYKRAIQIGAIALALLVLIFMPGTGIVDILITAIVLLVVVGGLEALAPGRVAPPEPPPTPRRDLPY